MGAPKYTLDINNAVNNTDFRKTGIIAPPKIPLLNASSTSMTFASRTIAPSINPYVNVGILTAMAIDSQIDNVKDAYLDKMKSLGIGRFAPADKILKDAPVQDDTIPFITTGGAVGSTLIDVLKSSSGNVAGVANAVSSSNRTVANSINGLGAVISAQNDVTVAYNEALLQMYDNLIASNINISELMHYQIEMNQSYADANLLATYDILEAVKSIGFSLSNLSENLNLSNGMVVEIKHSDEEKLLTSKKLEHIIFETTPQQFDNIEDDIPSASPQHMRAIKDAVVAKKNSDENTFEFDNEDYLDAFPDIDLSSIFQFMKKSERWSGLGGAQ
jgi:hypothetical protein